MATKKADEKLTATAQAEEAAEAVDTAANTKAAKTAKAAKSTKATAKKEPVKKAATKKAAVKPAAKKADKDTEKAPAKKKAAAKTAAKTTKAAKTSTAKKTAKAKKSEDDIDVLVDGNLVIVESPAKAKTIMKYLGPGFDVIASMGHIRDLPKSKLGVDVDNNFEPQYIPIKGKEELVRILKKKAKASKTVYLATDPDREGEAISWHLAHLLDLDLNAVNRITFNEITKTGVRYGMDHPRTIDIDLVNAQQARRILDRIVGYKISPFLWRKIKRGLSAGRVQSVAVRLIVDRENEIRAFITEEYWSIDAKLLGKESTKQIPAKLYGKDKKLDIKTGEEANAILEELKGVKYLVENVKKSVRKKSPAPPFTTSTMQQEASRKLGFQARRTMKAAQELYEGIDVKDMGAVGLITYMRTDSLRISEEAQQQAEEFITGKYGKDYLPQARRQYKSKNNSQDAHEAVRPTMPSLTPDEAKESLSSDQYKLYKLIWERFIASQMATALLDTVAVDIRAGEYLFKASGYSVKFDGFTVLYEEGKDEESEEGGALPAMEIGDELSLKELLPNQHFTQPPARFTEASLIKTLEENGIGRPSTYAPTITTILARNYVERDAKVLKPTPLGEVTTQLMEEQFKNIVDVTFTANMEHDLDSVETGDADWVKTLHKFYDDFAATLENAEKNMDGTRMKVPEEESDVDCELCGRRMVIKSGRFGKFLACPGFPECKNTKKIVQETEGNCPKCGSKMLAKKSQKGRVFYGCSGYPNCDFITWDLPLKENCPDCDATLFKKTGKMGKIYCAKENCDYERGLKD
ncbi:type I DNA topoisomerase [Hydrogenoanaerobacterium sp.]|uniref:type I DNA topoisomerase n=1 Tax=Hydrogenoanaerobacterium sp. TaxID=2953763 RepID=UPI00289E4F89|nr:type I DNA topoisomerase [Hydrogenoanaerobacterium sp.]